MSKEALKIGVDLGTEKDEQCAVINLHYNGIDHIIYETHDKEQIEALNKIKQQEAIDNANPSEALECLERIIEKTDCMNNTCVHLPKCLKDNKCRYNIDDLMCPDYEMANHIKQTLLKAQEQ